MTALETRRDVLVDDRDGLSASQDLAPGLAGFSHVLREELDAGPADDVRTTFLGHSYGGAVVGLSETYGLDADRVLHVESAGAGHGVGSPDDLPDSQAGVDRCSMTAPGDFIQLTQGVEGFGQGHGADPDTFDGTTRLDTGNTADGESNTGFDAHSGVFEEQFDAWHNMLAVLNGGEATGYRDPEYEYVTTGRGPAVSYQTGWGPGETVDVE